MNQEQMLMLVVAFLVGLFFLRALVVQLAYNSVAPRLVTNMGHQTQGFEPLTFQEALMFTLLITFLFC